MAPLNVRCSLRRIRFLRGGLGGEAFGVEDAAVGVLYNECGRRRRVDAVEERSFGMCRGGEFNLREQCQPGRRGACEDECAGRRQDAVEQRVWVRRAFGGELPLELLLFPRFAADFGLTDSRFGGPSRCGRC